MSDSVANGEAAGFPRSRSVEILIAPSANLIPSMMVATLGIALPDLRAAFAFSEVGAGALFSTVMIVAAGSSTIAGRLADKLRPKTVLVIGLALLALGVAGAGCTQSRPTLFFFLALTGLGYGFTPPSLYALMSDLLPRQRGLAASLVSVTYGLGGAIGAVVASLLIGAFSWRAAFLAVGAIAAAEMLAQLCCVQNVSTTRSRAQPGRFHHVLTTPLLLLALAEFVGGSVFWSSAAWTPTLLRTAKALTIEQTGWVMGLLSFANIVGSLALGALSDRFGRRKVIFASAFPAAAFAFVVFYWLDSLAPIAAGLFLFGTFKASVPALVVALAQESAPEGNPGAASGIIMSLHYASGVAAPPLAAWLISGTGDIVAAMIFACSVPLVLYGLLVGAIPEPNVRVDLRLRAQS
ncbi:MAG TPA: MFS transporter [Candidatus Eisenbacteria bacterium]|nr:MFS transporter [Candidatus Eisenbacteria bacterium]